MAAEEIISLDRNLALDAVRVTEAAARAAARLIGRGPGFIEIDTAADQAAVDAMQALPPASRQAVRQTRPGVHPDVRLHRNTGPSSSDISGWRGAGSSSTTARRMRVNDRPRAAMAARRGALISSNRPSPRPCFSNRCGSSDGGLVGQPSTAAPPDSTS